MNIENLEAIALRVREHIINMATNGGCFVGASLSATDLMVYLYESFLNISPENFNDPHRDYLFLSKGHDVPALYATFVEKGWLAESRLRNHLSPHDDIYWHPNRKIEGVEFHSGSLGHLPAVAAGVAYDCKLKNMSNRIICMCGDGELNEGSVWEVALVANAYQLDNLTLLIDRNHFQANMPTEDLIPLEPLTHKFEAFGWGVKRIDGHNYAEIHEAFSQLPLVKGKPNAIIADTTRGKGLPSIEKRADRWFCNFNNDEVLALIGELHGSAKATIYSNSLVVR